MLVLSRKAEEQIVIGDEIRITVLRVKGDRVKLGIQAGEDLKIMRGELVEIAEQSDAGPHSPIADPTAGLADNDSTDESATHPSGACDYAELQPNARPAWLTICCCS